MMLGFGSTEVETARQIVKKCLEGEPKAVQAEYKEKADVYKNDPNPPERYTTFYFNKHEIYPGYTIITFTMIHVNRRHPFSPDGWASLSTRWVGTKEDNPQAGVIYTIYQEA